MNRGGGAVAGPASPQLAQDNEAGAYYLLGFLLWVQAAHDDALLAATLQKTAGTNATDFLQSYQEAIRARLEAGQGAYLPVWAGALNLPASKLATKPLEGALRRERVTLSAGDQAQYRLYLPAGAWRVVIVASPGANLTVKLDNNPTPIPLESDKHNQFTLSTKDPAWHTLTLQSPGPDPVPLDYLRIEPAKEA